MGPKQSKRPSHLTVAASALAVCAILVGAAYFLRDPQAMPAAELSPPNNPGIAALLERCDEPPALEVQDGRTRTRCTVRAHPAFMIELLSEGDDVYAASVLVPLRGAREKLLERMLTGIQLFEAVAGTSAESFMPQDYMASIGAAETSVVFEGRSYSTQPVPGVGLIFVVRPEAASSAQPE